MLVKGILWTSVVDEAVDCLIQTCLASRRVSARRDIAVSPYHGWSVTQSPTAVLLARGPLKLITLYSVQLVSLVLVGRLSVD